MYNEWRILHLKGWTEMSSSLSDVEPSVKTVSYGFMSICTSNVSRAWLKCKLITYKKDTSFLTWPSPSEIAPPTLRARSTAEASVRVLTPHSREAGVISTRREDAPAAVSSTVAGVATWTRTTAITSRCIHAVHIWSDKQTASMCWY